MKTKLLLFILFLTCFIHSNANRQQHFFSQQTCLSYLSCSFTQTNPSLDLTYGPTSFSLSVVNFAVHYTTNPYTNAQWSSGINIGTVSCTSSSYYCGTKIQPDGRAMGVIITPTGGVIIKLLTGSMPPTTPWYYYAADFGNVDLTPYEEPTFPGYY